MSVSGPGPAKPLADLDVAFMVAGIVIGAGIFRIPSDIARLVPDDLSVLLLWSLGAAVALAGALTYAALARRAGGRGGEYLFLDAGWGPKVATLFVWSRMAVIQTGAIATVAFVAGDYASSVLPVPAGLLALGAVVLVTAFNLLGLRLATGVQRFLVSLVVVALLFVIGAGFWVEGLDVETADAASAGPSSPGLALVFVMLAYGGWNEAAYLSGETRNGAQGLKRGLVGGLLLVALLYLLVNLASLKALGHAGLAATPVPAALIAEAAGGPGFSAAIAVAVVLASLSTLNVTMITGARAMYALGQDFPLFQSLGQWDEGRSVPAVSLLVQGLVALALVGVGLFARDGFEAMVAFTAPVFWLFLLLVALVPFRLQGLERVRLPALPFAAASAWMLWSSIGYARFLASQHELAGWLGLAGLALVLLGVPLSWQASRQAGGRPQARP
ncbi:APC family permease [Thermaurantiacus sp.]